MPRPPIAIGKMNEPKWPHIPFKGNNTKGKRASKASKHCWLRKNHGRPSYCMNSLCLGTSKWFDWAKKTGRKYTHDPNDYLWLCRQCHHKYDMTLAAKKRAIKNLWWKRKIKPPHKPTISDKCLICGGLYYSKGLCESHYRKDRYARGLAK